MPSFRFQAVWDSSQWVERIIGGSGSRDTSISTGKLKFILPKGIYLHNDEDWNKFGFV